MDNNWDRHKSIVNSHHMKDVQQKMDSEYKAHLRHQEQVRENTECLRVKRATSQRTPKLLNATKGYSKPWQNGMITKTETPTLSGHKEKQNREHQYRSTVSKLPAIKKDKELPSKKIVYSPGTMHQTQGLITVSQPRITVEKKRLHDHQVSAKPSVTRAARDTARSKNALKLQSKEPKRPVKYQKQRERKLTNGAIKDLNSMQQPDVEQDLVLRFEEDHRDKSRFPPINSPELTEEAQTTGRPSTSRSHLQELKDGQTPRNINEDDDDSLSCVSDITVPQPVPIGDQMYSYSLHTGGSDCTDSAEEDSMDGADEEDSRTNRQDDEVNTDVFNSTSHDFHILGTGNGSYFGRTNPGLLQTSRLPVTRLREAEVEDQSLNSPRNLMDIVEAPIMNASVTLSQIHEISPSINVQNRENPAHPQTTFRESGDREMDRLSRISFTGPNAYAPLTLNMSSTAPNITLLRENLDLVLHTLSMQRPSERRNMRTEKPKTDPEKLKELQESLLQEDSEEEGDLCRICLMGGETPENSLTAPCQCAGSLKYVHTECLKKWLLAKIKSGAELDTVRTCEMCKQKVECDTEGFNLSEHYRKHQETQATLNPSLYLLLLLHLYQQRYEELLRLSHNRDRVSDLSRRFLHLNLGRNESSRDNEQDS